MSVLVKACFLVCLALASSSLHAAELRKPRIDTKVMQGLQKVLKNAGVPSWFFTINGDLTVTADKVVFKENTLHNVTLPVFLTDDLVHISNAKFSALDGDFVVKLELPKQRQGFSAHVQFSNIVLPSLSNTATAESETTPKLLFDNAALIPNWLHHLNGSLVIAGSNVQFDQVNAHNLEAQIVFSPQDVATTIRSLTDNGSIKGEISHTYETKQTSFDLEGQSVALSLLPAAREYAENIAVDFKIDIATGGSSAREWVSGMNGEIIAEFGNGKINVQKLDKLSQDILSLTLTSLLPISLGSTSARFDCGAIKLDVTNGLARSENSIALRTENLAIMGGGEINFANEQVALSLHPHARRTGKLNAKSAIKEVTVAGPIMDLQVKPRLGGIINQGISLTTKIATLSLSKIGIPILDWAAPADIACMKSLNSGTP